VPVLTAARLGGDDAVARERVTVGASLGWPDHPLAVDAEHQVADFVQWRLASTTIHTSRMTAVAAISHLVRLSLARWVS
jgi:hypothetical protein